MENFGIVSAPARECAVDTADIWRECFPASDAERDARLFTTLGGDVTLFITAGGTAAGMCHLVPVRAGALGGCYLFAVGVREKYRGMGGFRLLCRAAEEYARREGHDFLTLVPADARLDATYRRFGYRGNVGVPRFEIREPAELVPDRGAPPRVTSHADFLTIVPSDGFIAYLAATYGGYRLGDTYLICGDEKDGSRPVYACIAAGERPRSLTRVTCGAHGLVLPLTPAAGRLCDATEYYCSMGED